MNEESEQSNSVNQSVSNSVPQTTPSTSTEVPAKQAKNNNFLVTLLSILLLLAVGAAGFFAYQTQKLVQELRMMNDESKLTQVPTTDNLQPTTTPDPTADWETYTNDLVKYTIKYPQIWSLIDLTEGKQIEIYYSTDKTTPVGEILIENISTTNYQNETQPELITETKVIGGVETKCKGDLTKLTCFIQKDDTYLSILITKVQKQDNHNTTLDQILSTFEFIEN